MPNVRDADAIAVEPRRKRDIADRAGLRICCGKILAAAATLAQARLFGLVPVHGGACETRDARLALSARPVPRRSSLDGTLHSRAPWMRVRHACVRRPSDSVVLYTAARPRRRLAGTRAKWSAARARLRPKKPIAAAADRAVGSDREPSTPPCAARVTTASGASLERRREAGGWVMGRPGYLAGIARRRRRRHRPTPSEARARRDARCASSPQARRARVVMIVVELRRPRTRVDAAVAAPRTR